MPAPENELLTRAMENLSSLLGTGWVVEVPDGLLPEDSAFDARVLIVPPDNEPRTELLVVLKQSLTPRAVTTQLGFMREVLLHAGHSSTLLVVSPWISPRAQQELRAREIGYVDLTGNVSLAVTRPAIRLLLQGAARAPQPQRGAADGKNVTLRGPQAGRITRFLADFTPPYRAKDIADATEVSLGWVSRLLGSLEDQLLVTREGRVITTVDWEGLLRARAEVYRVLADNRVTTMVATSGAKEVVRRLAESSRGEEAAVTGAYAARAIAPVASGGQLMIYVQDPEGWADELGLLPVDEGADVVLLSPIDQVAFEGAQPVDGVLHAAPSQVVLDCLSGPGRMPAEGEAVLKHLAGEEKSWRRTLFSHDR